MSNGCSIFPNLYYNFIYSIEVHISNNPEARMPILILMLLIVAAATVFSAQNAAPVSVSFLFWRFEASLAIILFLTFLVGGFVGAGITSVFRIKRHFKKQNSAKGDAE